MKKLKENRKNRILDLSIPNNQESDLRIRKVLNGIAMIILLIICYKKKKSGYLLILYYIFHDITVQTNVYSFLSII